MNIKEMVKKAYPKAVAWRRDIHQHPELANKEFRTSALVQEVLKEAGIEVTTYPNSTAVMGVLKGGKPGKTIGLRADMDALPIEELADVPFKSQNKGVMHACGHDIHTANLLGVAVALAEVRDQVPGTIKFFFQPAEEVVPGGAKYMIADGVMQNPDVDYVFALHVSVGLEPGKIEVIHGYSHANADFCSIFIQGLGAHGAHPHRSVDAVHVAGHIIVGLHTIVSRALDPIDSGVITIGSVHGGTVNNVIAETAEMLLTVRTLTPETRDLFERRITEVATLTGKAHGAEVKVDYQRGYPSLFNGELGVDIINTAALKFMKEENIVHRRKPAMGGEDFAYFLEKAPGAIFYLGAKTAGDNYSGHNPRFNPDDSCIETGLEIMLNIILEANKR